MCYISFPVQVKMFYKIYCILCYCFGEWEEKAIQRADVFEEKDRKKK